ncbi:MAG TPA: dual specificity protein phosphatase family protein [Pyrinomonadaceae bacterium]|nr:dual specificity protein phosphatase family protein [Pyrinomonadaceae bacterium]
MRAELYWICKVEDGRLGVMPRPRGGDWLFDEVTSLRELGVDIVISLLAAHEIEELDICEEENACKANQITFISFPIVDRSVPRSVQAAIELAESVLANLRSGMNVVIHCRAGIGRSSLMAASVLKLSGKSVDEAFQMIESARGCAVPDTSQQREWVAGI